MTSSFADLLYEVAGELHAEARALKGSRAMEHSAVAQGAVDRLTSLVEQIHALLLTPIGPVLAAGDIARITRKYDPSGTMYEDIFRLVDSHDALLRKYETAQSIAERQAAGWEPGLFNTPDESFWYTHQDEPRAPMTLDQFYWFQDRKRHSDE